MIDGGVGIAAVVGIGSKFVEQSKFTVRHDASCDKEADKSLRMAERFDRIPQEDVDHFEFQEYNMLHSKSMEDLRNYRNIQEEYKRKDWIKEPLEKYRTRRKVRYAKRSLQSSTAQEERHLHDLETYSRANSSCGSQANSCSNSDSGLDLGRFSRPYRTDSCSIRALGGSPPSASLEDICSEEKKAQVVANVSAWLSSAEMDFDSTEAMDPSILSVGQSYPSELSEQDYNYVSYVMPPNIGQRYPTEFSEQGYNCSSLVMPPIITEEDESNDRTAKHRPRFPAVEKWMRLSLQLWSDSGTSITDQLIRQRALEIAKSHHIYSFTGSSAWIENFKYRHKIQHGEWLRANKLQPQHPQLSLFKAYSNGFNPQGPSVSNLQPEPESYPGTSPTHTAKKCSSCRVTSSVEWRKGPSGKELCNVCGLRYARSQAKKQIRIRSKAN